jgi:hypothetical protein
MKLLILPTASGIIKIYSSEYVIKFMSFKSQAGKILPSPILVRTCVT